MRLLSFCLALLFIIGANAECQCGDPFQTISPTTAPFVLFTNPTEGGVKGGTPCGLSCAFTGINTQDSHGLKVSILTTALTSSKINIVEYGTIMDTITKDTNISAYQYQSISQNVTLQFENPDEVTDTFMIVMQNEDEQRTTTPATTTAPPTTTTIWTNHNYTYNPESLANDVIVAVDMSGTDVATFAKLKSVAIAFVDKLRVETQPNQPEGSRLFLVGLNAFTGFPSMFAPPFSTDRDISKNILTASANFMGTKNSYYESVKDFIDKFDIPELKRQNAPRYFVLFTSAGPKETTDSKSFAPTIAFDNVGVHPVLVSLNMPANEQTYFSANPDYEGKNKWSILNLDESDDEESSVEKILNEIFFQVDQTSCSVEKAVQITANNSTDVSIPSYYNGKTVVEGSKWDVTTSERYCNYQRSTVHVSSTTDVELWQTGLLGLDDLPSGDLCFKAFYDLETGRDFVTVRDSNGNDVVQLTGLEVSGAEFKISGTSADIIFTSDEKTTFQGFHAQITAC